MATIEMSEQNVENTEIRAGVFTRRDVNRALLTTALALVSGAPAGFVASNPRRVDLFDFAIAGGYFYGLAAALPALAPGTILALVREPENPHDADAIAVHLADGFKLGFVPRSANTPIARLLDCGERVRATVVRVLTIETWRDIPEELVYTGVASGEPMIRLSVEGV